MLILIQVLQSMTPGCSKKKSKGYDDTISCVIVVSVSASCRCYNLALFSYFPYDCLTYTSHGLYIVSSCHTSIYSIDTILYPYALPFILSTLIFSQVFV